MWRVRQVRLEEWMVLPALQSVAVDAVIRARPALVAVPAIE